MNRVGIALWGLVAFVLVGLSGCLEDPDQRVTLVCPDREIFINFVSPMIERRCGTLDCHGSTFRPMRVFGELGLRHPSEVNYSGGDATTLLEADANYRAICSIQPELITEVTLDPGGQSVNKLRLVRKARGVIAHKGGKVFEPFDESDKCVVGWLRSDNPKSIRDACQAALNRLPDTVELPPLP